MSSRELASAESFRWRFWTWPLYDRPFDYWLFIWGMVTGHFVRYDYPMNIPLSTLNDAAALEYLAAARQHHSQAAIAKHLGVSERQVRRWEVGESHP
ncbi:helix-turn-helix transcriptional regulator, partial [Rhodoferax sp. OV413]|uniref:helix-turn-helix domain-containing protein n=1 Tax=Rhodoferax sp. OV413 TaxID=1855285 RepID=UPI0025D1BCBA